MTPRHADIPLEADEPLVESRHRQPGIEWPLAVDRWLEDRLHQVRRAGLTRATRRELAAALITARSYTDDELVGLMLRYGRMTNGELLDAQPGDNVLTFRPPGPGPRTSRSSG